MLLSKLIRNNSGFGMVMVMVLVASLGGVTLYLMNSTDFLTTIDEKDMSAFDREVLETEVEMILGNENNCSLSLAGENPLTNPVTFRKSELHDPAKDAGLPVEVWIGSGKDREVLKYKDGTQYYDLKLTSLRLFMPQGEAKNFPEGEGKEVGVIRVKYKARSRDFTLDVPVSVGVKTNSSGLSTIMGCRLPASDDLCDSVGMMYNELTGSCFAPEACDGYEPYFFDPEEVWSGDTVLSCSGNVGARINGLILSQYVTSTQIDTNGLQVQCCYPRTLLNVRCVDFEEVAGVSNWSGDMIGYCESRGGGFLQGVIFSQDKVGGEVNGLMIKCCYPSY